VKHNVVNLSDGFSDRLCYAAAHTGVIYDKRTRKQIFLQVWQLEEQLHAQGLHARVMRTEPCAHPLQGHCNSISCLASTEDRSIIITADIGNESLLVLWDAKTGNPVKSISQPHSYGIMALDVSPGGEWLATVGAPHPSTGEQEVSHMHSTASRHPT
jgi:WD40 repeat protein